MNAEILPIAIPKQLKEFKLKCCLGDIKLFSQMIIIKYLLQPYYKKFFNMKVEGLKNIPQNKSVIFASTHSSYHDPTVLSAATNKPISFMAKKELFEIPVLSNIIKSLAAIPVNRNKLEVSTIKKAKACLKKDKWNLGIFPQGTRVPEGKPYEIKEGFGYIAKMTKSPVVPVLIDFKWKLFPVSGTISVKIDKPIEYDKNPEIYISKWQRAINNLAGRKYVVRR